MTCSNWRFVQSHTRISVSAPSSRYLSTLVFKRVSAHRTSLKVTEFVSFSTVELVSLRNLSWQSRFLRPRTWLAKGLMGLSKIPPYEVYQEIGVANFRLWQPSDYPCSISSSPLLTLSLPLAVSLTRSPLASSKGYLSQTITLSVLVHWIGFITNQNSINYFSLPGSHLLCFDITNIDICLYEAQLEMSLKDESLKEATIG